MVSFDFVDEIKNGAIFIVGAGSKKYFKKVAGILERAINRNGLYCVYVTFNRPYRVIAKDFKKQGVDVSKTHFIDAVTRLSEDVNFEKNCSYVDSPTDTETVSIYIRNHLEANPDKKKFVIIDSLSNVINLIPKKDALFFTHLIANKLRLIGVGGSIMAIIEGGKKPAELKECEKFVDRTVSLA